MQLTRDRAEIRVLAVANQKGVVSARQRQPSTLAQHSPLSAKRCLIIDIDAQGNASTGVGVTPGTRATDDLRRARPTKRSLLQATASARTFPNLYIVPATPDLVGFEAEHLVDRNRAFRLRDAINGLMGTQQSLVGEKPFSYVLIDCPPSLSLLTLNSLVAAHAVIVPVQCEFFALEGISQLSETIEQIRTTLNPALEIQGVVLTMHDARTGLSHDVADEVRKYFGNKVYETMIPRNVKIAEAPSYGQPILIYDYDCPGSQAYVKLATEIIDRERTARAA